jgi:hypothetical protein
VKEADPIGRSFRCPDCGKDLRSCKNCRHYLPGARGDCAESSVRITGGEIPSDRERGNFCDWFSLDQKFRAVTGGDKSAVEKAAAAKTSFDDLFK